LFGELGWETADCFREFEQATGSPLGRETAFDVVLIPRLRRALEKLNPKAPAEAIVHAIEEITRDRRRMHPAAANQEIYRLLKEGVKVRALTPALQRERGLDGSRGAEGQGGQGDRSHPHDPPLGSREKRQRRSSLHNTNGPIFS
jgi:hypothetical protein